MQGGSPAPKHHVRLYLVVVTVLLGSLFYVLMTNSQFSVKDLTGSSVGVFHKKNVTDDEGILSLEEEEGGVAPLVKGREADVFFSFNQVPVLHEETRIAELEVRFIDANTLIKVNDDQLDLQNLEDITLKVKDFVGQVQLDSLDMALDGMAKRIEVNGIAFSGKTGLSLALEGVDYHYVLLDNLKLKKVAFPRGNGELDVAEKFSYVLEQEEPTFYNFVGKLIIDQQNASLVSLEGIARGLDVEGALINVGIR